MPLQESHINNLNTFEHENRQDVTNQESFGKYVDAEQEIEKRRHHLEDRKQALRTEPNSPLNDRSKSFNREEETNINKDKGRSARQG